MGDRVWVSVVVTLKPGETLTKAEAAPFVAVCNGEAYFPGTDETVTQEDYHTAPNGQRWLTLGQEEVSVGYMADIAKDVVDMMRAGELPKRSFDAEEDGYDGLGWKFNYDAEADRVVQGSASQGSFQIDLDSLVRWYEDHHRDGNALMRMILKDYNVKLAPVKSPVISLIERLNTKHI